MIHTQTQCVTPHLQRVQHALPGHDDLLGLLLHWQRADEGSNFLGCLPFGQLQRQMLDVKREHLW